MESTLSIRLNVETIELRHPTFSEARACIGLVETPEGLMIPTRVIRQKNLVVLAGRNMVRDYLDKNASDPANLTHFASGSDSTAVTSSDTALGSEAFRDAVTSTTASPGSLLVSYFMGTSSANGTTIREAGLFNAASAGTMFARAILSTVISKTSSRAYTFNWTITISAS